MADKALLLGINDYENENNLHGCVNDVATIRGLLTSVYGFSDHLIHRHVNDNVIKQTVLDEFEWLIRGTEGGDRLVFHFSGHGSYVGSVDSDENVDELICLYDMDWDDPDSYLLDDELGRLANTVPEGVILTFILDSCFSGTGTRALEPKKRSRSPRFIIRNTASSASHGKRSTIEQRLLRGDAAVLRNLRPREFVLARFMQPPKLRKQAVFAVRSSFQSVLARRDLNHQLLAAATDNQTAADAFIDGGYHGAFSYFLAKAAEAGDVTAHDAITQVRHSLTSAGYQQTPQNEGPFTNHRIFGAGRQIQPRNVVENVVRPRAPARWAGQVTADALASSDFRTLLRVADKFVTLSERLCAQDLSRPAVLTKDRVAQDVIVYVHGISRHRAGYSVPWWNELRQHLGHSYRSAEVVWSDVVNPRSRRLVKPREAKASAYAEDIRAEIRARAHTSDRTPPQVASSSSNSLVLRDGLRGNGLAIDDFVRYMTDSETRAEIKERFQAVVRPLLDNGASVHVISHSWGTVVAYEALRDLDDLDFIGSVASLFLVGSALSLRTVQRNLFRRVGDGRRPSHVERIMNLDATGDPIGGPLGAVFDMDQEYLSLEPLGCWAVPLVNVVVDMQCAHSSYFVSDNVAVVRDIFAAEISR